MYKYKKFKRYIDWLSRNIKKEDLDKFSEVEDKIEFVMSKHEKFHEDYPSWDTPSMQGLCNILFLMGYFDGIKHYLEWED